MKKSPNLLYGYAAFVTAVGLIVPATALSEGFDAGIFSSSRFWLLSIGVIVGEFVRIKVPHRQEILTVTVGDPFTLSLLFTFGLGPAVLVKAIATLLDDTARRQTWWKALFNVSQFSISLSAGYLVVRGLGYMQGASSLDARSIVAALAAAIVYFALNMAIVTTAISIAIGESPLVSLRSNFKTRVIQQGALLGFTPVVTAAIHESGALFPLLMIPIMVVYYSGALTQRHVTLAQQLRELYETTRMTKSNVGTRESVRELLERICNMFNATGASITLFPVDEGDSAVRTTIDLNEDAFAYMVPVELDPTQGVWARAASENRAILLASPIENPRLRAHFGSGGVKDLMIAAIHSEDGVNGVIDVRNRRGEGQTFTSEDLKLFETVANHASIALENTRLISELEESLVHLTEMNQLKDDFVASVSHELRTPLTSIQGYVKTLLREDANFDAQQQRSFLETVDRQSNRLHRLIEDLLAVSRLESQTDATTPTLLSIPELTKDVVDELRDKARGRTLTIDLADVPAIETDAGKVHQILLNLIDNALKYTPESAPIIVRGRRSGEGVSLSVIDHGSGIPPDQQEKIFDRFFQVDQSATRAVGGTGLGLYICRRMAEAIGGRVWLERSDDKGSIFSVWLPARIPDIVSSPPVVGSKLGKLPA